jgi:hypothetical protein
MRLIDANALIEESESSGWDIDLKELRMILKYVPTIDAVPVVCGEWKRGREFLSYPRVPFIGDAYYCSNCEEEAYWDTDYGQQLFGFCPNCGAKMESEGST